MPSVWFHKWQHYAPNGQIKPYAATMLTAGASQECGRNYFQNITRTKLRGKPRDEQMLHVRQAPDSRYAARDCRLTFAERVTSGYGGGKVGEERKTEKRRERRKERRTDSHSIVFMIKDENTSTIVTLNVMACNLRKPTLGYNERAYQQSEHSVNASES